MRLLIYICFFMDLQGIMIRFERGGEITDLATVPENIGLEPMAIRFLLFSVDEACIIFFSTQHMSLSENAFLSDSLLFFKITPVISIA